MTLFDYMGEAKQCSRCNDCHWDVLAEDCPKDPCYTCAQYHICKTRKESNEALKDCFSNWRKTNR